jgi:hypothetical protein
MPGWAEANPTDPNRAARAIAEAPSVPTTARRGENDIFLNLLLGAPAS